MSSIATEIIFYRGENYPFFSNPLFPFLQTRKDINFEYYCNSNDRGYQGYWKLENNKLYLTKIESAKITIEDIFKTSEPVFADWFSDRVTLGFGNCVIDKIENRYYENYLWLKIENGNVLERKIYKKIYEEPILQFGRYKGLKLDEIIYTKNPIGIIPKSKNYIDDLLQFIFSEDFKYNLVAPSIEMQAEDIELVESTRKERNIEYLLANNFVAFSALSYKSDTLAKKLSLFLERVLASDFNSCIIIKNKNITAKISEHSLLLNPDLEYLNWRFQKAPNFFVPPSLLNRKFKLRKILTFEIKRLNSNIFEYRPIIEEFDYEFPIITKEINQKKFETKFNLTFNSEIGYYSYNISDAELFKKFGFYLDESYSEEEDFQDFFGGIFDYDEGDSNIKYAGSYAQDVEGLSDNFIDDALGGDPDAYWNID